MSAAEAFVDDTPLSLIGPGRPRGAAAPVGLLGIVSMMGEQVASKRGEPDLVRCGGRELVGDPALVVDHREQVVMDGGIATLGSPRR